MDLEYLKYMLTTKKAKKVLFTISIIMMVSGTTLFSSMKPQLEQNIGGALLFFGALLMLKTDTRGK